MEAEVYETKFGLAVVTQDAESARKAIRKARRTRNRLKATRRSQRRTGGSRGKATWMPRAKRINKIVNKHNRKTAKTMLTMEKEILEALDKHAKLHPVHVSFTITQEKG